MRLQVKTDTEDDLLSEMDARVLQSMLRDNKLDLEQTSNMKKLLERGIKKDGGVGRRVTGRSKRKFKPNLQPVRILTPEGTVMTLKLSTKVIKRGVITLQKGDKTVSFPLVKAIRGRNRAFTKAQKQ